jgi:glycosyltransferase involved in cell wall biosynthesis
MPLLSIIIPTFNPGAKLGASIESVRALSGVDEIEILVQDGASTDETCQWLAAQSDVSWQSAPDEGVFDAMNRGVQRASGDWLLFLGAGDLLRAEAFVDERLCATLERHRAKLALVYGDAWLCEEGFRYGGAFSRRKLRSWVPSHQTIFYNRRVFEILGNYETKYPIAADYALNLKCWGDSRVEKIYLPLVVCDYEGRGLSKQVVDETFERDKMRLIRQRLGFDAYLMRRLEILAPHCLKRWRVALLERLARQLK